MFMFLPFLCALLVALAALSGREKPALCLWVVLLAVALASFSYHVTSPLALAF